MLLKFCNTTKEIDFFFVIDSRQYVHPLAVRLLALFDNQQQLEGEANEIQDPGRSFILCKTSTDANIGRKIETK